MHKGILQLEGPTISISKKERRTCYDSFLRGIGYA